MASREAYDNWHSSVAEAEVADTGGPWHDAVRPYFDLIPRRRVLEIGCGRGGFASEVAAIGPSLLVACDFSETAIRKARELTNTPAFVVADIQHLPFRHDVFDVVLSLETIEHVPKPKRAVAQLAWALKPGGTLLLTTPNYLGFMGLFRAYKRITGEPFTEIGQPINKLVMLPRTAHWVKSAGLKVVEATSFHQYLPFPGRPPIRLRALDRVPFISRLTGLHSLVRAVK